RATPATNAAATGPAIDREREDGAASTDFPKAPRGSGLRSTGLAGAVDTVKADGSGKASATIDGAGFTDGGVSTSSWRLLSSARSARSPARSGGSLCAGRAGTLTGSSSAAAGGGTVAGDRSARDVGCATASSIGSDDGSTGSSGRTGSGSNVSIAIPTS